MTLSPARLLTLAATVLAAAVASEPAGAADAAAGEKIAKQHCAACHMRPGGPIVLPGKAPPPPFAELAKRDGFAAETVAAALAKPKHPMRHIKLTDEQIADVAAFILTLK